MGIQRFSPARLRAAASLKAIEFKAATQSKETFLNYIQTQDLQEGGASSWSWTNEDLLPTPIEKRTWRAWNYAFFYSSLAMDNWTLGSSLIGVGLNWWQSIIAIFVAQVLSACIAALNSRCSAVYHIGFPVVARSVFGMYGSYYAVGARAVLAIIYYSIKIYVGSSFVVNMLQAVFGSHFTSIPNSIPVSVGFTTQQMLAFFLYWLIHIPFVFFRPNQLKWLFTLKICTMVPAITGLFIFCMVNTGGNLGSGVISSGAAIDSKVAWLFFYGLNAAIGANATLVTNQPDYSRWSRTKWASTWTQLVFWPISVTIAASFGVLATAAINNSWGIEVWNQWDLLTAILERYPHASARFAVFLCAAFWAILVLGTNIAANSIPLGSDMSMLLPRYMNMVRGQFLGLILAWAMCPWKIMASAATFTTFLGGYGLFMGGLTGIMIADYFVITKGNLFMERLYDGKKTNTAYHYVRGWNVNAYLAYIAGCAVGLPGFCGDLGANVSSQAKEVGYLGYLLAFFVSIVVYLLLCTIFPTQSQKLVRSIGLKFEEKAAQEDFYLGNSEKYGLGTEEVFVSNVSGSDK